MTAEGRQLGVYRLHERIGAGGMGEVYRARDTRLGRDVAIKILTASLTDAPGYRERFEREARVLAALNHPNIAAIYGIEDTTDGGPPLEGLVLELVEGQTLDDRIRRGRVPLHEALAIVARVADALESAHDRGIVHRDLKPANIRLTPAGVVKVLDFGLARELDVAPAASASSQALTIAPVATQAGLVIGTAPYMSPEQARGAPVDQQTDVWALGCVLYGMLTGRAAFRGATVADVLAAVLEREPDWSALPRDTPPLVARLLRRCLEKDPRRRLHHMADVRTELEDAMAAPAAPEAKAPSSSTRRAVARQVALAATLVVAVAVALSLYARRSSSTAPTRLSISVPGVVTPQTSVAVSPDGRRIAYVSTDASGRSRLSIRDLDSLEPRVLTGTEDAAHPFWSPDGRSIGFLAAGRLKRVDLEGRAVVTLAETNVRSGAAWSSSGVILFVPRVNEFATVPAGGGPVTPLRTRMAGSWPFFLPDGRRFLFVRRESGTATGAVYVGSLDSEETTQLVLSDFKAAYAHGYLLSVRGETIMAQPFDAGRLRLSGEPLTVAEGVWAIRGAAQASFSANDGGVLAYVNSSLWNRELQWTDRTGRSLGSFTRPERYATSLSLSPDGARVAVARGAAGAEDLWVIAADGSGTRVTFGPGGDAVPVWADDGRRLLYQSIIGDGIAVLLTDTGDPASEMSIASLPPNSHLWDWSRDARYVVYSTFGTLGAADLWVQPLTGDRTPVPFVESAVHKTQAQISPDGRWLAYTSYETGRDEVYVESFPKPGTRRQISPDGGMQPRWRDDGRELFYLRSDQYLMSVPLTANQAPAAPPVPLFRTQLIPQGSQSVWFDIAYDVAPDGQRFLLTGTPTEQSAPITVVLDWLAALRR
jgi:serine/threonine protein kinase/Tol biopolymer transport system component